MSIKKQQQQINNQEQIIIHINLSATYSISFVNLAHVSMSLGSGYNDGV
jgi:hypothetical protein